MAHLIRRERKPLTGVPPEQARAHLNLDQLHHSAGRHPGQARTGDVLTWGGVLRVPPSERDRTGVNATGTATR